MSNYYGRRAILFVGAASSLPINPIEAASSVAGFRIESTGNTGLRMTFAAEKTLRAEPNKLEIELFNLSDNTRGRMHSGPSTRVPIVLEAGYDGSGVGVIFAGHTLSFDHTRERTGWVTKIRAASGHELNTAPLPPTFTFSPGTLKTDVLNAMMAHAKSISGVDIKGAAKKLVKGDFKGGLDQFARGIGLEGPVGPNMTKLARDMGLRLVEHDGELMLLGENDTANTFALVVGPTSGLVGSPVVVRDAKIGEPVPAGAPKKTTTDKELVIRFESLMSSHIFPGAKVRVQSETLTAGGLPSDFRVHKSTHTGDTHGPKWSVEAEAVART